VVAGDLVTCAIASNKLYCWGSSSSGALGCGLSCIAGGNVPTPHDLQGPVQFPSSEIGSPIMVSLGPTHTCALLDSGKAYCFGMNDFGQLGCGRSDAGDCRFGIGDPISAPSALAGSIQFDILGASEDSLLAQMIVSGDMHSCALLRNGNVKCWGNNEFGQLGCGNSDGPECQYGIDSEGVASPLDLSGPVQLAT